MITDVCGETLSSRKRRRLKKRLLKKFRKYAFPPIPALTNKNLSDKGFQRTEFDISDVTFDCHHYPCENPRELLLFITGCHSKTAHYPDRICEWADSERDVWIVNLKIPSRKWGFTNVNSEMVKFILTSDESPIIKAARQKGLPIKIQAHSYGGNILTDHLRSPDFIRRIIELRATKIQMLAPFYSAPALDSESYSGRNIKRPVFFALASRHPYMRSNETLVGTGFEVLNHYIRGEPIVYSANGLPAAGQILEMQLNGDKIRQEVAQHGFPEEIKDLRIIMMAGKWDKLSAKGPIRRMAEAMSAIYTEYDGWHNPVSSHPHLIENGLNALDQPFNQVAMLFLKSPDTLVILPSQMTSPSQIQAARELLPERVLAAC